VVGEASTGQGALDAMACSPVDLVAIDLALEEPRAVQVAQLLNAVPVVLMGAAAEEGLANHLLRRRSGRFFDLSGPPGAFLEAVLKAPHTAPASPDAAALPHDTLTSREREVFQLLIAGHTMSEVAYELSISKSTASNHLAKVRQKLSANTVAGLVRYAHRVGLVR